MSVEQLESLIIGGGQAGIAMSAQLSKRGRPHLVLERHRIAERWRSERWDGLRLQSPNSEVHFSDYPFPYTDPDAFASAGDIANFITAFADTVAAPVRCGVAAKTMRRRDNGAGFRIETSQGPIEAANVVVATGPFQRPSSPLCCPGLRHLPSACRRLSQSGPTARRRRAGRWLRRLGVTDCRRTNARRASRVSFHQSAPPTATSVSWTHLPLVVGNDGHARNPGGEAPARSVTIRSHRRLWWLYN